MAQSVEALSQKMQEMNLTNEVFYGEHLSSEEKSMAFSFESLILSEEGIKKLLEIVDKTLVEYFFDNDLSKIGWCSNYRMDSRIIRYPIEKSSGKGYLKKLSNN